MVKKCCGILIFGVSLFVEIVNLIILIFGVFDMVCPFEILHFLPLCIIALAGLFFRALGMKFYYLSIFMSVLGIVSGTHSHYEHAAFFGAFDPCWGYYAVLAVSFLKVSCVKLSYYAENKKR